MFGYITINKPELKCREFDVYRGFYCGLCKSLKASAGNIGRLSLSYDMTFLYLLLTGLYEPKTVRKKEGCVFHPLRRVTAMENAFAEYVADMSVLMTCYKCRDDLQDDGKALGGAMLLALKKRYLHIRKVYPVKTKKIAVYMKRLDEGEQKNRQNPEYMSGLFGKIMGELFVCREDMWEPILRRMGFYLGKYIYLLDAYEDIEQDRKKGRYNPLMKLSLEADFHNRVYNMLLFIMAECAREFEKLPIFKNAGLLRNILYAGVWAKLKIKNL